MHGVEPANARLADACFGTTSDHHRSFAVSDQVESRDDGMRRRGTSRHRGKVGPPETITDRDHPSRDVQDHLGNVIGAETWDTVPLGMFHHLVVEMGDAANACGQNHSHLIEIGVHRCDVGVADGFFSRDKRKLSVKVIFANILPIEIIQRIVVLDLRSKMRLVFGGIETSNLTYTILPLDQPIPKLLEIVANGCNGP